MSDFVVHKGHREAGSFARHYDADTIEVTFEPEQRTTVLLNDARSGRGTCLGCSDPPCMVKRPSELSLVAMLEAFPGDPSLEVCPTGAIVWEIQQSVAVVQPDICIGCGLCVSRCPYGAIRLSDGLVAQVADDDPDGLLRVGPQTSEHSKPIRTGRIGAPGAPAARSLPNSIRGLPEGKTALFVRNLFHEVGANARTRRRGDTNVRIDAVGYTRSARPFAAEIEMDQPLETPRALLEDVAILFARYHIPIGDIDPVAVLLTMPSRRSEYYRVVGDIEKVLGLRCRTITVGSLLTLLWQASILEGFEGDTFYADEVMSDLTRWVQLGDVQQAEPYPGAFVPAT